MGDMVYVVGSGPSGISAAYALVKKGLNVTLLDAGIDLELSRRTLINELKSRRKEDWDAASVAALKENVDSTIRGMPLKRAYGSDFPYRGHDAYLSIDSDGVDTSPSLAVGGFSNVWGAAVLPFAQRDLSDWPISLADLAPHYSAVLEFMALAAQEDDLARTFPLYSRNHHPLPPSKQAVALMGDLERHKNDLTSAGVEFGYSRLAVRSFPTTDGPECVHCGLCLYGCPLGAIYNASETLARLAGEPNFTYHSDVIVRKLSESRGRVLIAARTRTSQADLAFEASRVYLGCGPLSTTAILLNSLEAFDEPVQLKSSEYFLLPLIRYKRIKHVEDEELFTLSQIFVEVFDRSLGAHTIHLQIYAYNDLMAGAIRRVLGRSRTILGGAVEHLLGRLLIIQGYLHSDLSRAIRVTLRRGEPGAASRLVLQADGSARSGEIIGKLVSKLFRLRGCFEALPIRPLLRIGKAGRSFHTGGSFPMTWTPSAFQSDRLGRPHGFERVHIVDSSTFPSIPATTITLSIMANAHRIASAHDET